MKQHSSTIYAAGFQWLSLKVQKVNQTFYQIATLQRQNNDAIVQLLSEATFL